MWLWDAHKTHNSAHTHYIVLQYIVLQYTRTWYYISRAFLMVVYLYCILAIDKLCTLPLGVCLYGIVYTILYSTRWMLECQYMVRVRQYNRRPYSHWYTSFLEVYTVVLVYGVLGVLVYFCYVCTSPKKYSGQIGNTPFYQT
jgi:hypothetical protein